MKILIVTPEVDPFVKVGGLADVAGALPKQIAQMGHDVRLLCPLYGSIRPTDEWHAEDRPFVVRMGNGYKHARLWQTHLPKSKVIVYFVEHRHYFDRHEVYTGPWGAHGDNDDRFAFLSRAGIDLCYHLHWFPDVIHAHDWPTALLPVMLNTTEAEGPLNETASVLTLHNLEHQGIFNYDLIHKAGLPEWTFRPDGLESLGKVNMLKGGIYHATKLTTVSPTYAQEIQHPIGGAGLHDVLKFRAADLVGILNGVDSDVWNPAVDPLIPTPYSANRLAGKKACKEELQRVFHLKVDPTVPVFGVISRFAYQKGLDLLEKIITHIAEKMRVQFVILGEGDKYLEHIFGELPKHFSGKIGSYIGFSNVLAHLVEAGSDFLVMPSRFEPCGLNQMYSMIYGTVPIVRATGGFVDSVEQYAEGKNQGTGFMFWSPTEEALYNTIGWACATYHDRPAEFERLRLRGMRKDFSWKASAQKYLDVYKWAIEAVRG